MKRLLAIALTLAVTHGNMTAQRALMIQREGGVTEAVATDRIDYVTFSNNGDIMLIAVGGSVTQVDISDVVELSFGELPSAFIVQYSGSTATVVNPYFADGVTVALNGADVVIDNGNTQEELTFELTGETSSGSLLYNGVNKTTFVLNGVSIANANGPAINIQCGKRALIELKRNTVSTLSDGTGGDWKAALYCKGHLEIDKAGTLNVTGNTKHAISAKEYLQLKKSEGTINILGAKGDGIHCGQYFLGNGFNLNIDGVEGDGIQAELSGDDDYDEDYPDGSLCIQGGSVMVNCTGNDAAGLKADTDISICEAKGTPVINCTMSGTGSKGMKGANVVIEAGEITIANSGSVLVEGTETQTSKCISADASVSIMGGTLNLTATGAAGKCIKSDGTITVGDALTAAGPRLTATTTGAKYGASGTTGGTTGGGGRPGPGGWRPGGNNAGESSGGSSAKAIKAKGIISIHGGQMEVSTAADGAEGLESKTSVNIAGGRNYFKCYDDCISSSGAIAFNGGVTVCCSTGNDAVDSNYGRTGAIVIGDGTVLAYSTRGGAEMGFDCDGNSYIQITGNGTAISAGGSQGGSGSSTINDAAQGYVFVTNTISYQTGRYYTLSDSDGNNLVTYSFDGGNVSSSCSMFTATGMTKGESYTVKYSTSAPTDAAIAFHGLYLGSSAAGTTSVTSFTAK